MERYRLGPDRAFSFLVRTSQAGNLKLREVAAGIVEDATRRAEEQDLLPAVLVEEAVDRALDH